MSIHSFTLPSTMTDSATFLSTLFLPTFIDAYRSHRCLWQVKCPEYSHRPSKTAAYKDLIRLTRKTVPNCDINFIKRKIEILRGSFRREYRKVRESMKPGGGSVYYKPKLWYYHLLLFLKDQEDSRLTASVAEDPATQDFQEVDTFEQDEAEVDATFKVEAEYPASTDAAPTYGGSQKRMRYTTGDAVSSLLPDVPFLEHQDDEFDKFGAVVAAKLRRMTAVQEIFAENLINQVLFNGMLGRLQENSTIELQVPQLYNGTD